MRNFCFALGVLCSVVLSVRAGELIKTTDWPAWRGPTRDGIAPSGQNPPIQWSESEGILWKVPIPGKGHGSPTIVGEGIFFPTSDPRTKSQSVLCLDRTTGKQIW